MIKSTLLNFFVLALLVCFLHDDVEGEPTQSQTALSKILGLEPLDVRTLFQPDGRSYGIDIEAIPTGNSRQKRSLVALDDDNGIGLGTLVMTILRNVFYGIINYFTMNYFGLVWNVFYIVEVILKFFLGAYA